MGILIDSSVIIHVERTGVELPGFIEGREDEDIFLSVVSASELLHGAHRATDPRVKAKRTAFVEGVLSAFPILPVDLPTARAHAQLWSDLRSRGDMIGIHDAWLAAACLAHGLRVATLNAREFERVPGLDVEVWK